jgi:hypothetical protein
VSITTRKRGDKKMPMIDAEYRKHLLERLKKRKEQGKLPSIYRLNPGTNLPTRLTPEQRIKEAEEGTPLGEEELFMEYELMQELKRRGGIK